jgi:thioredoxin
MKKYILIMNKEDSMSEKLTKEEFQKKVFDWEKGTEWKYEGSLPAILDFYADWCGPCKMVGPILDDIAKKYEGKLVVYKVNTDEEQELAGMFNISSIPALFFVPMEGDPSFALGALPKAQIEKAVKEVLKVE